jgi:hypothetical protein
MGEAKKVKKVPRFSGPAIPVRRSDKDQQRRVLGENDPVDVEDLFGLKNIPDKPSKAKPAPVADTKVKKGKKDKSSVHIPTAMRLAHRYQAPLVRAMVDQARSENGNPFLLVGSQTEALHIGIPMYADPSGVVAGNLALEYLLGMNVFPLGLFIVVLGQSASGKSSLGYEFQRYFYLANGTYRLVDAESKFSPELVKQMLREAYEFWQYTQVSNVESWQTALIRQWDNYEKLAKGKLATAPKALKNIGYTIPHLDLVDTISGKSSAEQQETIETDGAAGRSHPVHALSISGFLRAQSHRIQFAPISTVFINQEKKGTDARGLPTSSAAGGQSVRFQESIEIQMNRIGEIPENQNFEGYIVKMAMKKNSMMPEREIVSRILTADIRLDNGEYQTMTWFDWDWALVKLLIELKGRLKIRLEMEGIKIGMKTSSPLLNSAYCEAVGVPEDAPVSWSKLGRMLHENIEIRDKLRRCLGISMRHVLEGDFRKQQSSLLKKAGSMFTAEELSKRAVIRPITSKKKKSQEFAKKKDAERKAEAAKANKAAQEDDDDE